MDFARKQMEKYGWKDGEGLGKDGNQGITIALKPRYKTGKEGMGFDISKDLVDTWWTRSYSDSLNRINVSSEEGDKIIVSTPSEDIDNDRPMAKMRKRMLKANFTDFTKGAILSNGEMLEDKTESSVPGATETVAEVKTTFQLTDEELLRACGGRTAHKAARFGMKLSGKLARIASQEESISVLSSDLNGELLSEPKVKKFKKRKHRENIISYEDTSIANEVVSLELPITDEYHKKKKKNKKHSHFKEAVLNIVEALPAPEQDKSEIKIKKSKKHKKKRQEDLCQ